VNEPYPEKVVTFIDILGFSELVRKIGDDDALHKKLNHALTWFNAFKSSSEQSNTAQSKLQITTFSDSVVISGDHSDIHSIFWTSLMLQAELLGVGVLLRGGVSKGRLVHKSNLLYGEGMLRAYALESKVAVYPRIVVDESLVAQINQNYQKIFLRKDTDGMWFLDPFSVGIRGNDTDSLLEDGYDPHEEALKAVHVEIANALKNLTDAGQRVKWMWLQTQLAIAESDFHREGQPRYWASMKDRWPKK
jgi:hypothetical protein